MKKFYLFVSILLVVGICNVWTNVHSQKKIFPTLRSVSNFTLQKSNNGLITYFYASNSINGPFTSPAVISTRDSLFIKMDVTPGGTVNAIFWIDVNSNDIIDPDDFPIGQDSFSDNSTNDLDQTPGVILVWIETDDLPSMKVIAQAFEGMTEILGYVEFVNPPAPFSFSGTIYDKNTLQPIKGAMIFAFVSENDFAGDLSDVNGNFDIPVDSGWHFIKIDHMLRQYQSFDTLIYIDGDMIQNFYLATLTSYIKGFVRDDLNNPIPYVRLSIQMDNWNGEAWTDSSGEYLILVPAGNGAIWLSNESLIPNYLIPMQHYFSIGDNDSIVDNQISNFVCYRGNATITGQVIDNIHMPPFPTYVIGAWSHQLSSYTETLTDGNGNYTLSVHSNQTLQPTYGVWVRTDDWRYPFPEDVYVDTSYWNLVPGSVANFRIIAAETSAVDPFIGNYVNPDPDKWYIYSFGSPWGSESYVLNIKDKLEAKCKSNFGLSGIGVMTKKPFSLKNREYRIYIETQNLGQNNTAHIMFTNQIRYDNPDYINNWIKLNWSASGWSLDIKVDNSVQTVWSTNNPIGGHILFQFLDNPKTLRLKIDGDIKYESSWGSHLPFAYFYAFTQNEYPNNATSVFFDEFFVGAIGSTGIKEISDNVPSEFKLFQNYPNPFNPKSYIKYQLFSNSIVKMNLYNLLGQEVGTLINSEQKAGTYEIEFDASHLSSGIYFYRINAFDPLNGKLLFSDMKKAILIK